MVQQRDATGARTPGPVMTRIAAFALAAVALAANLACLLFVDFFGPLIALPVALGTFAGVGLVLVLTRPGHPVGWLFLTAGALFALTFLSTGYAWWGLVGTPGSLPLAQVVAWLNSWVWVVALGTTLSAVMLFPTGRPPSPRWWPVMAVWLAGVSLVAVTAALAPDPILLPTKDLGETSELMPNPFGLGGPAGDLLLWLVPFTDASAPPMFLLVVASIVARFRRATGIERLQLKWFTYAASLALGLLTFSFVSPRGALADIGWATGVLSFGAMPVAAGIAILRYRLYDIDVLINRTLVYGAVSAGLVVAYLGAIILFQTLLRPFTSGSEIAVAGSTLLVVALFQPLRRRVQEAVDRRFYRARYDAARTLDAFAVRLRDEVDLDDVRAELVRVLHETVRPAHVSVWLRR